MDLPMVLPDRFESPFRAVLLIALTAFAVAGLEAKSQVKPGYFEGTLGYVASEYAASGRAVAREPISVLATPTRLLFPSLDASEPFANNAPPGVESLLVRNDENDMILYGDGYDAYRFKGYDMTLLGLAFKALALSGVPTELDAPEYVGKFMLRGHRTDLWRYRGEDGLRIDAYFTDGYRVNWGVLSGSWLFGSGGLRVEGLDRLLARGQVPVRIEMFSNEVRRMSLNLVKTEEVSIAPSMVSIPHPKILRSSTQLLMDLARK